MFVVYVYCNGLVGELVEEPFKKYCSSEAGKLLSIVEDYVTQGYKVLFEYAEVI